MFRQEKQQSKTKLDVTGTCGAPYAHSATITRGDLKFAISNLKMIQDVTLTDSSRPNFRLRLTAADISIFEYF